MDEDLTAIDPAFIKCETVRLISEQALAFVRHRSVLQDSSNAARMERQAKYLAAFYEAALAYVQENEGLPSEAITSLSAYMHSDFSVSELEHLLETLSDYERGEICRVDGRFSVGDFVEFYPNEKAMKALAIRFFYEKNTD
jgi:anionic cell wall polymer biosynthesis LytR-Cps2A-Psr (LCP) family protein